MACQKNPYPNQFLALRALGAILAAGKPGKQKTAGEGVPLPAVPQVAPDLKEAHRQDTKVATSAFVDQWLTTVTLRLWNACCWTR